MILLRNKFGKVGVDPYVYQMKKDKLSKIM